MEHAVVISGFGGQGLLFAGQVLAQAAMLEGREVLWIPSYGPEMRGGSAACTVIVGDEPIGSPVVDRADVVVALTRPSFEKYGGLVERGGLLVSIVALGAVLARRPIVGLSALRTALERVVGAEHPGRRAADLVALDSGLTAAA